MITNFNDISFEDGNVLEMSLDWFDSYTILSRVPEDYLSALLKGMLPPTEFQYQLVLCTMHDILLVFFKLKRKK
jgi:hypothetical protein